MSTISEETAMASNCAKFDRGAWAGLLIAGLFGAGAIAQANEAHEQLSAMPEAQRQTFFATYLTRDGERCPVVEKTFYQGSDAQGNAFWDVACQGAESWVVQVFNDEDGSTKIVSCREAEAVKAGHCFRRLPTRFAQNLPAAR
jgi:hypothetical protein